jgi:RNA polymerase sigma-70 factor (ECF subfamily)
LSERQRFAILAVHFEERSIQETAEHLDTSPNTVYKMLHDARKKIRAQLLARYVGPGDILALFER